jgi:fructosamine-3-kinase
MTMMDQIDFHPRLVALLQQIFGNRVELVRQAIVKQHYDYLVLTLWLRHPSIKVVVKLAGPGATMASSFDRTAMLHRLVASHTTIPMPEILAVDVSCRSFPWRYLVRTYLPGKEWWKVQRHLPADELTDAYQQLGAAIARLHTIHFSAFGELDWEGHVLNGLPFLDAFRLRARKSISSTRLLDIFLTLLDQHALLFQDLTPPSLCHEDLHAYNVLFHLRHGQWRLATLLDFEKAWAGNHEIDLARMEFWRGVIGEAFWPAYTSIIPMDSSYAQRRPIYQLLWCLEYARPTPEHLRDTQGLCAQLGLPLIESFD